MIYYTKIPFKFIYIIFYIIISDFKSNETKIMNDANQISKSAKVHF